MVEEEFNLPQVTLKALSTDSGLFSRFLEYADAEPENLDRIGIYIQTSAVSVSRLIVVFCQVF